MLYNALADVKNAWLPQPAYDGKWEVIKIIPLLKTLTAPH